MKIKEKLAEISRKVKGSVPRSFCASVFLSWLVEEVQRRNKRKKMADGGIVELLKPFEQIGEEEVK